MKTNSQMATGGRGGRVAEITAGPCCLQKETTSRGEGRDEVQTGIRKKKGESPTRLKTGEGQIVFDQLKNYWEKTPGVLLKYRDPENSFRGKKSMGAVGKGSTARRGMAINTPGESCLYGVPKRGGFPWQPRLGISVLHPLMLTESNSEAENENGRKKARGD